MTLSQWAPLIGAAVAVALRLGGERLGRPAAAFAAGSVALMLGWGLLQGLTWSPRALAPYALVVLAAAALGVTAAPAAKRRGKAAARSGQSAETYVWLGAVALFGGWWLAGAGTPRPLPMAAGTLAIATAGLLAADAWAVAAASVCLGAAVLAVGGGWPAASLALVAAGASLGAGPLLPLAAGLGAAAAAILNQALAHPHRGAGLAVTPVAPLCCLLLLTWWRARFARFGAAAAPIRAAVAAGLVCLAAFSAAAMEGLR
jgi:hypothetical protein